MIEITVYGQPGCQQCVMTKNRLDKMALPYTYRDITQDQAAFDTVSMLGYKEVPVVTAGDMHWSKFRITKLDELKRMWPSMVGTSAFEDDAVAYLLDEEAV